MNTTLIYFTDQFEGSKENTPVNVLLETLGDLGDKNKKWKRKPKIRADTEAPKVLTRKRQVHASQWIKNERKHLRQSGKEYFSDGKQKKQAAKKFSYKRCTVCKFKCNESISQEQARNVFEEFWSLSDDEKSHFFEKTTRRLLKQRTRHENLHSDRPRTYSFQFFFEVNGIKSRVCKAFYLGVLAVSQRRVSYFHEKKKSGITQTPTKDRRGKSTKKRVPEDDRQRIRDHINSFPRVDGHYCRKNTNKAYFEQGLNLSKMYDLYIEWCLEKQYTPQKKWLYDNIFNNEFNIGFFVPKKDQCDYCEEHKTKTSQFFVLHQEETSNFDKHIQAYTSARNEKQMYKESVSGKKLVVCFDMQRVLTCPQSSISVFYYS